jgi:hypothetical protein
MLSGEVQQLISDQISSLINSKFILVAKVKLNF